MDTLGTLKAEIEDWLDEDLPESRVTSAVNDAIESLWTSLMRISVSTFISGPVDVTFNSASNLLITVRDPTTATVVSDVPSSDPGKAAHTVRVGYTYVTDSGSETLLSPITSWSVATGQLASVHYPAQIAGILGWNLYASDIAGGLLILQNPQPLGWDNYFTEPESGYNHDPNGPYPPTENTTADDICYIQHLEVQLPDTGFRAYEQADIASLMMRRFAGALATSSVYQNYAYDFINQRQVEIRPSPVTPINSDLFYVKRPRRLAFDKAPLPFLAFPSIAFLRDFALAKLALSIREFDSAKGWGQSAEMERHRLEIAFTQLRSPKHNYISPGI